MRQELGVSERRACRTLGPHRSAQRKVPQGCPDEARLTDDFVDFSRQQGRYGYRPVTALLNQAGWHVNHNRPSRRCRHRLPGRAWENGYCESSNARFRDELLNGEIFYSLKEAQILMDQWRKHYTSVRPHSAPGHRPPEPESIIPIDQRPIMH